jgi:hypothetical protein
VEIGAPTPLFEIDVAGIQGQPYDVSPDGTRFVLVRSRLARPVDQKQSLTVTVPLGVAR